MALPAFAAERRAAARLLLSAVPRRPPLSIDTSCAPSAQQQNRRRTPQQLSNDGTDGRTDRRTLDRYTNPAPHRMWVVSINSVVI